MTKFFIKGRPLPDLCNFPIGIVLLEISPALKEVLARGFVVGVVFSDPTSIQMHEETPEELFKAVKSQLYPLCEVELAE
jgi:hypothetical protein